jgi:MFS transporter, DHA2 family, methylenomycin A resistance protein
VALPGLAHDFKTGISALQWVIDAYTLVFAAFLLTGGSLGDRLGDRRVFLVGMVMFTTASAACAISPAAWVLVAFRLMQGLGAALCVPASLALLRAVHASPAARAKAFGIWGAIAGIAAASGPVLGGVLTATLSWRAVFLVNVPIGLAGLVLASSSLPRSSMRAKKVPPDLLAQLVSVLSLASLTLALIEAGHSGWSSVPVLFGFALFLLSLVIFIVIESRSETAMLPVGLFKSSTFSAGNAVGLLINLGFYGQLFIVNLYFQQARGYSALLAGLAVLPQVGLVSVGSFLSGRLSARAGPRPTMLIGLCIGAIGLFTFAIAGAHTPYVLLVVPLMLAGFGMSFTMPAATIAVVEQAPDGRAGIASAVINSARQVGSAIGVALLGSLVARGSGFIPGLHIGLTFAGAAFVAAWVCTFFGVYRRRAKTQRLAVEAR